MNKDRAIVHYRLALIVIKQWVNEGIITDMEFLKIKELLADKYGLSKSSIYH